MSCCLQVGSINISLNNGGKEPFRVRAPAGPLQFKAPNSKESWDKTLDLRTATNFSMKAPKLDPVNAQAAAIFDKALRWWEKSLHPNMVEIGSAQEFVDYVSNAGDKLVVVDFYSPGCGGCKALHPKICQFAEMKQDSIFLKMNYEQHRDMCHALHVHVLPFFRFYRGAQGRVCSFSCTNATIKKFKDALSRHGTDWCSLGPTKGLDESELSALASIGQISKDFILKSTEEEDSVNRESAKFENALKTDDSKKLKEGNAMVTA